MARNFYGFRYFAGRHCTTEIIFRNSSGMPVKKVVTAGELVKFDSLTRLHQWIRAEDLGAPCGLNGGERVRISKRDAIKIVGGKNAFQAGCFLNGLKKRKFNE